ncbi:hypothetical protein Lal_00004621 [Lupinus albus]|nr:hypothetical protein Lal_00004621 [Lupinus albus]
MSPKGLNNPMSTLDEWIPACDEELKPVIGKIFDILEEGSNFYKSYAHANGFSVRNSSETTDKSGVKWKYFLCSKEGYKVEKKLELVELLVDEKRLPTSRRRKLTREGCKARIEGKFTVQRFHEDHTHALATPRKKQFLRSVRSVNNVHKNLLFSYSRANVGTSKSWGYDNIGCTQRNLQNYSRDLKVLIKDSDAHVFIDNFRRKCEMDKSFYYDYEKITHCLVIELWNVCVDCGVKGTKEENGIAFFDILDNTMVNDNKVNKLREVVYQPSSNHVAQCSCKMFESEGMLCRHILFVLKGKGLSEIPKFYIVNRWTTIATSKPVFDYDGNILEACSKSQSQAKMISYT